MDLFYHIKHRGKIALLLLTIIGLELFSNKSYKDTILTLGASMDEVYVDRLVAQDYIHKMSEEIYFQKIQILKSKNLQKNSEVLVKSNAAIKKIVYNYETTKLTKEESAVFLNLKKGLSILDKLIKLEKNKPEFSNTLSVAYEKHIDFVLSDLTALSHIQILRGKELNADSKKVVSFTTIINQFDWALLLVIGIVIQAILFCSESIHPKLNQNQYLN